MRKLWSTSSSVNMGKGCGLLVLLLCLLSMVWRGVNGEEGEPVLIKVGDDAVMQWELPEMKQDIVTILLDQGTKKRGIFMGSVREANRTKLFDKADKQRINVVDTLKMHKVIFILKNVTEADAGRFKCIEGTAEIPIIDDCGQMLVVVGKPDNCTVLASSAAVENNDLTLECSAITTSHPLDHGLPKQVQWFDSEGSMLSGDTEKAVVQENKLLVRSIQRNDKGLKYSCRASDGLDIWSEQSDHYTVIPEYGPAEGDIDMSRSEVAVAQGELMQQQCSAQCNPPCAVSWRKKQREGQFYTVKTVDALLDFPSTTRDSGGEYHCVAENKHGTAYRKLNVVVRYPSSLEKLYVNGDDQLKARLNEGDNVTIRCQFDSNPAPTVRWYSHRDTDVTLAEQDLAGQTPLVTQERVPMTLYTSQFSMQNVQCSDTGLYVCKGENSYGFVTQGEVQLDVVCVPRNTHGDLRLKQLYLMPANQPLFIKFQLEGYPRADIVLSSYSEDEQGKRRWEQREEDYNMDVYYEPSHPYLATYELIMPSLKPDHFDRIYYFKFENSVGTKVLAFKLRERGAPKPPKNVTSIWTDTHRVHLRWLPGFHGGKPQTFMVHYHTGELGETRDQPLVVVPAGLEETLDEKPKEMTVGGLNPGTSYTFSITAMNEYGNTTSSFLTVTTLATAAASTDAGAIAGAVIGVILVIVIICVIVFVFVIKPRRKKATANAEDSTREPMLTNAEDKSPVPPPRVTDGEKADSSTPADTTNNNAGSESTSVPPVPPHKSQSDAQDNRERNQDGLIYADLDLDKNKESSPVPERKDAVNYETIVFTPQPQPPPADADEVQQVDEEQQPKA